MCQLRSMQQYIFPFSLLIWYNLYMCILSMLQSTGGVSIDRFDGGPDRLANSCKHPPSQHRLLYLYLCLYKIQKDRLANCCKYSPPLIRLPHKRVFTFRLALLGLLSYFDCKHPPPVVTSSLYHICV